MVAVDSTVCNWIISRNLRVRRLKKLAWHIVMRIPYVLLPTSGIQIQSFLFLKKTSRISATTSTEAAFISTRSAKLTITTSVATGNHAWVRVDTLPWELAYAQQAVLAFRTVRTRVTPKRSARPRATHCRIAWATTPTLTNSIILTLEVHASFSTAALGTDQASRMEDVIAQATEIPLPAMMD